MNVLLPPMLGLVTSRIADASPTFLPARPVTAADVAALTERVRRRVIRWFRLARLLDSAAAADMLAWENSGFSGPEAAGLREAPRRHEKNATPGGEGRRTGKGLVLTRETGARDSRAAHQSGDA
jgi:hypothetical protein